MAILTVFACRLWCTEGCFPFLFCKFSTGDTHITFIDTIFKKYNHNAFPNTPCNNNKKLVKI